jgi:hypothetical protein
MHVNPVRVRLAAPCAMLIGPSSDDGAALAEPDARPLAFAVMPGLKLLEGEDLEACGATELADDGMLKNFCPTSIANRTVKDYAHSPRNFWFIRKVIIGQYMNAEVHASRCNTSMGNLYKTTDWQNLFNYLNSAPFDHFTIVD